MLNIDMFVVLAHNFDSQILHIKERGGRIFYTAYPIVLCQPPGKTAAATSTSYFTIDWFSLLRPASPT
jgi:hypothetical protein